MSYMPKLDIPVNVTFANRPSVGELESVKVAEHHHYTFTIYAEANLLASIKRAIEYAPAVMQMEGITAQIAKVYVNPLANAKALRLLIMVYIYEYEVEVPGPIDLNDQATRQAFADFFGMTIYAADTLVEINYHLLQDQPEE